MRPTDATDPFGFGSLDDIFRAMNQGMDQPQQPNAQTRQLRQAVAAMVITAAMATVARDCWDNSALI